MSPLKPQIANARAPMRLCALALKISAPLLLCSCHPSPASVPFPRTDSINSSNTDICKITIQPLSTTFAPPPEPALPVSQLVASLKINTAPLLSQLANQVPRRVATGNKLDTGSAGQLSFTVDRSPFSLSLRSGKLHISTELAGQASLCKPIALLGCVEYGSCSPSAIAEATLPLSLDSSYKLGPASFSIRLMQPCHISLADFDATPLIQSSANREAQNIRAKINHQIPSLEVPLRSLWSVLGLTIPLGLRSRLRFSPEDIVVGSPELENKILSIPVGVRLRVSVEPGGPVDRKLYPLPVPLNEAKLQQGLSLDLPILLDSESISESLSRSLAESKEDPASTRILSVRAQPTAHGLLALMLSISGPVCGNLLLLARPFFNAHENRVRLSSVEIAPNERERLTKAAPTLELDAIARAATDRASIDLPVDVDEIPKGLRRAVALLRPHDGPEIQLTINSSQVSSVIPCPRGILIIVEARGHADILAN